MPPIRPTNRPTKPENMHFQANFVKNDQESRLNGGSQPFPTKRGVFPTRSYTFPTILQTTTRPIFDTIY